MALSDYCFAIWGNDGLPHDSSVIRHPITGNYVEAYKDWLYVGGAQDSKNKGSFSHPTIAQVNEGNIHILDFSIKASRSKEHRRTCFFFISYSTYNKKEYKHFFYGGIAAYAWKNKIEEVLTANGRKFSLSDLDDWCMSSHYFSFGKRPRKVEYIQNFETREKIVYWDTLKEGCAYNDEQDYLGVNQPLVDEFFIWLNNLFDKRYDERELAWVKLCEGNKDKFLNINQGNLFFENALGIEINNDYPVILSHLFKDTGNKFYICASKRIFSHNRKVKKNGKKINQRKRYCR